MNSPQTEQTALTPAQGQALVHLARQTLIDHFKQESALADPDLDALLSDPALAARRGIFVTLKMNRELRGCIGSLSASSSIVSGVKENALNAALRDPRFAPLTAAELTQVQIEVSVLTQPVELAYDGVDDLLARLRAGIDGVIIKKGYASATFLPQVWDQLPDAASFLSHLCSKAGLTANQWREGDLAVETYQVQYFEEDSP